MPASERPVSPLHHRALLKRVDAELAQARLRCSRLETDRACAGPNHEAELEARIADVEATIAELEARHEELTGAGASAAPATPANDTVPPLPPPVAEYLSTKEAAALLGVSVKHLETLRVRGGSPPYVRLGRAIRYPRATLTLAGHRTVR